MLGGADRVAAPEAALMRSPRAGQWKPRKTTGAPQLDCVTGVSWITTRLMAEDGAGVPGGPYKAEPGAGSAGRGAAGRRRLEYARHGRSLGGESQLEEEVVLTPSRRQLRRREAGWEGSPRQNPAPRYTNRVEGWAIWVSLLSLSPRQRPRCEARADRAEVSRGRSTGRGSGYWPGRAERRVRRRNRCCSCRSQQSQPSRVRGPAAGRRR
jgi:hypothetical protein